MKSLHVNTIERLKLLEGVDLDDIVLRALTDVNVVVVSAVRKGNLIPIALLATGLVDGGLDVAHELVTVLLGPVGDADHLPHATLATDHDLLDDVLLDLEAPVVRALHWNSQVVGAVLVLLDEAGVGEEQVGLDDVRVRQQVACRHEARDVVGLVVHGVLYELDRGILVEQLVKLLPVVAADDVDLLDAHGGDSIEERVDDSLAMDAHEGLGGVKRNGDEAAAEAGRNEDGPLYPVRLEGIKTVVCKRTIGNPSSFGCRRDNAVDRANRHLGLLGKLSLSQGVVLGRLK